MHLVVLYKSVITGLLWILLLSGELPSSYLSLRKEVKVLDSDFPWNLCLGTEACNKLVRDGAGAAELSQGLWSCKAAPPDLHRAAFVGFGSLHYLRFLYCWLLPVWDVGAERTQGSPWLCPLALSTFFCSFTGLSYPFFYISTFLVGVSRNAEKSDFFFPTKTYICGFISQMTEDLEMGPVLLRLISELQLSVPPKAPSHTTSLRPLLQAVCSSAALICRSTWLDNITIWIFSTLNSVPLIFPLTWDFWYFVLFYLVVVAVLFWDTVFL